MRLGGVIAVLGLCALSGCAALGPTPPPAPPALIPPKAYGRALTLRQQVTIQRAGKTGTYNALVQLDPKHLRVIWFATLGARLFSADWNGASLCVKAPAGLPGAVSPAWLLADVQAVYAPLPALRRAFAHGGWRIARPRPGVRVMSVDGRARVRVEFSRPGSVLHRVTVSHPDLGLKITIRSRRLEAAGEQEGDQ